MLVIHPRQYRQLRNEAVLALEIGERAYLAQGAAAWVLWVYTEPDQWIEKYGW